MNTRAVAGTDHTLNCTLENFNSSGILLLYTWSIANKKISTCTSEQCVIHDVQFTDASTDYRCEVRRCDNTVIAISDNTSLEVSSKLSIIYSIIIVYSYIYICLLLTSWMCVVPQSRLQFQEITIMQDLYVGSNVTYRCHLGYKSIKNIAADISISGPGIDQNLDHVLLGEVNQITDQFSNTDFERRLEFNPISSQDFGNYYCNATVRPAEPNPLVITRMEETTQNIQVFSM